MKILLRYLEEYPRKNEEYLFTTIRYNNQLTSSDLRKTIRVIATRTGIQKRVYPHLLRHTLASNLRKRGANIEFIKEQLGHDYIESTMIYAKSCPLRTKSEFEFFKPAYM